MLKWLLILGLIWLVWRFFLKSKKSDEKQDKRKVGKELFNTSNTTNTANNHNTINSGHIEKIADNIFCINPKSPFRLTFKGITLEQAQKIRETLDKVQNYSESSYRTTNKLTYLLNWYNAKCIEVEDFIDNLRPRIEKYIEERKKSNPEWHTASEKDKEDLLAEFRNEAIEHVYGKTTNTVAIEILLFDVDPPPNNLKLDVRITQLLNLFAGDEELYNFYIENILLGTISKARRISPDHYHRKHWESLIKIGLARQGKDIPFEIILNSLRLKDINQFFSDRINKNFYRKQKAIEFVLSQPDAVEVLSQHIALREFFQLIVPEGIDINYLKKRHDYAYATAILIYDTYSTAYYTLETIEKKRIFSKELNTKIRFLEIDAQHCCRDCQKKYHNKKIRITSANLPPHHIGCKCFVDLALEE
ncbi:MAG: hypothetical protein GXO48_08725 [Chlorobi bacterium]|nr:hypothetical protein [Chlorobiota bacterium]